MAHVVFLRAANVGGRNVFRPAQLALTLAHHDVVNVGAAGTFVVRGNASAAVLRREITAALPFALDLAIVPAAELRSLVSGKPFAGVERSGDVRGWAACLCARPRSMPQLPIVAPPGAAWAVRVDRIVGSFALGLLHRRPRALFPNAVVEKALGVPATTRWWETLEKLAAILESGAQAGVGSKARTGTKAAAKATTKATSKATPKRRVPK